MTQRARQALADCDVIVGYTVYVELVKAHFADKEFLTTPMRKEVERCSLAFERAAAGQNVAMICSGDAGVYGMSGLIYELSEKYPEVEIEIVPGVSAVISGAAILGAPLMHDFAVISLSDLLTPWEKIEKRLLCAAEADFVICLYNPSSMVIFILGSLNFGLHYAVWQGKRVEMAKNIEVQSFVITSFLACALAAAKLSQLGVYTNAVSVFRRVVYNVLSAHTTTGFGNVYARQFANEWGDFGILVMNRA